MTVRGAHANLEQALALSGRMLAAAEDGAWDRVAELERECRRQLEHGYPDDSQSRTFLAVMLEHNRMLQARVKVAREGIRAKLAEQCGRYRALGTYMAVIREGLSQ